MFPGCRLHRTCGAQGPSFLPISRKSGLLILLLLVLLLSPTAAFSRVMWVVAQSTPGQGLAKDGAGGDGSAGRPLVGLARAAALATPGDTLLLNDGIYAENGAVRFTKPGTPQNPIVIKGFSKRAIIANAIKVEASNLVFDGVTVSNSPDQGFSIYKWNSSVPITGIKIRNCTMFSNTRCAVWIGDGKSVTQYRDILVENCTAYDNCRVNSSHPSEGQWPGALQMYGASGVVFRNNKVYKNHGEGMTFTLAESCTAYGNTFYDNWSVEVYLDNAKNCVVRNNLIFSTGDRSMYRNNHPANGIQSSNEDYYPIKYDNDGCRIYNNIIVNTRHGFYAAWGSATIKNFELANNVFFGGTEGSINVNNDAGNNRFVNNIIARSNTGRTGFVSGGCTFANNCWHNVTPFPGGSSEIVTDPLFMSPGVTRADGYVFRNGSPCIDKGTSVTYIQDDYRYSTRPQGKGYDIGAYESSVNTGTLPTGAPNSVCLAISRVQAFREHGVRGERPVMSTGIRIKKISPDQPFSPDRATTAWFSIDGRNVFPGRY